MVAVDYRRRRFRIVFQSVLKQLLKKLLRVVFAALVLVRIALDGDYL